ncbi:hypothetical protein [Methylobacterium nigriterrae]|uniref:hypothetical protein n=1 Tax=Methylobacterium nigriterrae TaxID=3127512 RepID=UPI003013CBDF
MRIFTAAVGVACLLACSGVRAETQKRSTTDYSARHARCLQEARLKRFERRFAARNQFMRRCMARS